MLQHNHLTVKPSKSNLFKQKSRYLGVIIDGSGSQTVLQPDSDKITALHKWPQPTNIRELQSFLGFVNFYRKFIKVCLSLAAPLTKLLPRGTPFTWLDDQEAAFSALKDALSALPKLTIPCPTKTYDVYVDASDFAFGAVLEQEGKPVVFASRTLTTHKRRYSTYDKELAALFYGLKQFQCYIWGLGPTK